MRNPRKTFREPSRKPLSQKKQAHRLDLVGALIYLIEWRDNYMEMLHNDKRTNDTSMASIRRATR